jgi:hypothetical protein
MKKVILFLTLFSLIGLSSFGQETGILTGTLRDQLTNDPLLGVKVTAGGQVTRTDEAGLFSLSLPPGTFDIRFNRYGLQTVDLEGINMAAGDTVLVDTTLLPVCVPVGGVFATDDGYSAEVSWVPSGPDIIEKLHDDGQANELYFYQEPGSQVAVKYDADGWEHVIGGRIFVGDGTFPGPFLGTGFLVRVYDDQGMSGLPGNILDEDTVIVDQYGWVGFDSLDAVIRTDSFYMAMVQINDAPGCAPIACSTDPANGRTITKNQAYNWQPFYLGNAMIRPWVAVPHDSLKVYNYRIGRLSGFDPDGNPFWGTLTELATTSACYYVHNTFLGYYFIWAYVVKGLYNNGLYSPYEVSNIVYYLPSYHVAIKINSSDTGWNIYPNIRFRGQTPPFYNYSGLMQDYDTAVFNAVMTGEYQLTIYKPSYEKLVLDSIDIHSDTIFEVTLQKSCNPVKNLRVNPFTALLDWEANSVGQFSWKCDTPGSCNSLITPELDLSSGYNWTLTVSYNYNSTTEPASVDFSTDHGRTWEEFYQLSTNPGWDTIDIDLSSFSGEEENADIMFQIHDYQGQPYYLELGEVRVWTSDLESLPLNFQISLNGETAGSSDTTYYQLASLENGNSYHAGVYGVNCTGPADTVFADFIYHQLFPPENFNGYEDGDTLRFTWSPPSGSWDIGNPGREFPSALTGYRLHYHSYGTDHDFIFNHPSDTIFSLLKPNCDTIRAYLAAIYDLTDFGYTGESFESEPTDTVIINEASPYFDDFYEDWAAMSFTQNCWALQGQGMAIVYNQGNPGPALTFQNIDQPYQSFLTSYPIYIPQTSDGNSVLEFDLKLSSNGESGHETLEFQALSDESNDWIIVQGITNSFGNIDWKHFSVDLGSFVETDLFRIRLKFSGYGGEVAYWTIDNIQVHNVCTGPQSAFADKISESAVNVSWNGASYKADSKSFVNYRIYRDFNDTEYLFMAETGDTSYLDTLTYGGKYCYRVTAFFDDQGVVCESPESESVCITSFLGIPEDSHDSRVVCYPNPAGEYIMIKSEVEIKLIELYNSTGTIIKVIDNPGLSYRLDLNELPDGIYLIRIDIKDNVFLNKILHQ